VRGLECSGMSMLRSVMQILDWAMMKECCFLDDILFFRSPNMIVKWEISQYNNINNVIYIVIKIGGIRMPDINELLNIAIKETENLSQGEVFLVRDLFKGYEWNRISRSERLLLGTLFLNYVNTVRGNIQAIEKTSSGQQKYIMNKDHNYEDRPESKVKETYV
jgi:hypothetical protein